MERVAVILKFDKIWIKKNAVKLVFTEASVLVEPYKKLIFR